VNDLRRGGVASGAVPQSRVSDIWTSPPSIKNASHSNPHLICEPIRQIATIPMVIEVAREYLGVEPISIRPACTGHFPQTLRRKAKTTAWQKPHFHYDIGDYRSLVLFIYLPMLTRRRSTRRHEGNSSQKSSGKCSPVSEKRYRLPPSAERIRVIYGATGKVFLKFDLLPQALRRDKKTLMPTISYMLQRTPLTADAPPACLQIRRKLLLDWFK